MKSRCPPKRLCATHFLQWASSASWAFGGFALPPGHHRASERRNSTSPCLSPAFILAVTALVRLGHLLSVPAPRHLLASFPLLLLHECLDNERPGGVQGLHNAKILAPNVLTPKQASVSHPWFQVSLGPPLSSSHHYGHPDAAAPAAFAAAPLCRC